MKFIDEAMAELDNLDGLISSYKIHLNVCTVLSISPLGCLSLQNQAADDDISYIQSQNRGLQVQTQNQRVLLNEIENLLVRGVIPFALYGLNNESKENRAS